MKFLSIAVLSLLSAQSSNGFIVRQSSCGRPSLAANKQRLFVGTTELTAESSVGQSTDSEEESKEESLVEDIPIVEVADVTADAATESDDSEEPVASKPRKQRIRHTLFVGNLPFGKYIDRCLWLRLSMSIDCISPSSIIHHVFYACADADVDTIRSVLSEFGEVRSVTLPLNRDSGKPRGFAFVDMATAGEMETAIAGVNGRLLDGRVLRASPSLPKDKQPKKTAEDNGIGKIYVGNIAYDTTKEMLAEHFEQYGTVFEVYLPLTDEGNCRGFGFVSMRNEELESVIDQSNGAELNGRSLSVSLPRARGEKPKRNKEPRTKVYVGNLSFYTIEETLEEVFSEFGTVYDAYIPVDPSTGSSRGFGFVSMSPEDAERAIAELDDCELDGRYIRVNEAQPKQRRAPVADKSEDDEWYQVE